MVEGAALEMLCSQKEPRVRIPNSPPRKTVVHDTMGYRTILFFYRKSPYIKRFSEQVGANVLSARIFLFGGKATAAFCFAPPLRKIKKLGDLSKGC